MSDLEDLYSQTMSDRLDFGHGLWTLRIWDGMDGCWSDVPEATNVSGEVALTLWSDRTKQGTVRVRFSEIDYYRIFPADTKMFWSGEREMFRGPESL